jgi:methanethiol S-methyltransferase
MRNRFADVAIGASALVCAIGGLALFVAVPVGSLAVVRVPWPEARVLLWDGLLSLLFFLQHSGMVRRQFRAFVYGSIPFRYHRALYSIASGIALAAVALLWQPGRVHLLVLGGPFRWLALVLAICAFSLFGWGAMALRKLDLFGTRAIAGHEGIEGPPPVFIVRGPYRWVRHPWYLAVIMLFWSCTDFTAARLLFNVLWTGWVVFGTRLEEVDLVHDFGHVYEDYQRQVPMLIPWHRAALASGQCPYVKDNQGSR